MIPADLGRPLQTFESPFTATDATFAAQRIDGQAISNGRFAHCTFINVSFKDTNLATFSFLNCVFVNCYFRRATLQNCSLVGCRFIDCDFPKLNLVACDFRYVRFRRCQIDFSNMRSSLPNEPNLRRELCRNLASESSNLGLRRAARSYRLEEMAARERHLWNAVRGESDWYSNHYRGFAKLRALLNLTNSLINRYLFGYGESLSVLLRTSSVAALVVFPLIYRFLPVGFAHRNGDSLSVGDCVLFSISTMFPIPNLSNIHTTMWFTHAIAITQAAGGVIVLAFAAAYVFRWSLR